LWIFEGEKKVIQSKEGIGLIFCTKALLKSDKNK
jgi:hypothetical protein